MERKLCPTNGSDADQQPPVANGLAIDVFKHNARHHGTGQKDARAAKRKYYLNEGARYERLTEGGDFVLKRAKRTLEALWFRTPVTLHYV